MRVSIAELEDLPELAHLLWSHASSEEQATQSVESFADDLGGWWRDNADTHFAFVARTGDAAVVGMAWLALVPRVPRPGTTTRLSADIQSVFVLAEQRGQGIGSELVQSAVQHAARLGVGRVTVHSSRRAVPIYERRGFASSRELLHRLIEHPTGRAPWRDLDAR